MADCEKVDLSAVADFDATKLKKVSTIFNLVFQRQYFNVFNRF